MPSLYAAFGVGQTKRKFMEILTFLAKPWEFLYYVQHFGYNGQTKRKFKKILTFLAIPWEFLYYVQHFGYYGQTKIKFKKILTFIAMPCECLVYMQHLVSKLEETFKTFSPLEITVLHAV